MQVMDVVCPSGLAGKLRALEGADMQILSDQRLARSGLLVDKVLEASWIETDDPGPYNFGDKPESKPDWQQVLQGDRFFLVTRVRAVTLGPLFSFEFQCSDSTCKKKNTWELDLLNELVVKDLSEVARANVATGNRFEGVLPDGKRFWYRLRTGADERYSAKMGSVANAAANIIPLTCSRILEIEGVEETRHRVYFEKAPMGYVFEAIAEMDQFDCGVETSFQIECPECAESMAVEIPFGSILAPDFKAMKAARAGTSAR